MALRAKAASPELHMMPSFGRTNPVGAGRLQSGGHRQVESRGTRSRAMTEHCTQLDSRVLKVVVERK